MALPRERIINFFLELNRTLRDEKWTSITDEDQRKLRNAIDTLAMEVLNGYLFTAVVEDILSWLYRRTRVDIPALRILLLRPSNTYELLRRLTILDDDYQETTTFKLEYTHTDDMSITVPYSKGLDLKKYNIDELVKLVERYYILNPNSKYSISGPPEFYHHLSSRDDDLIEVVEGFASPFDHNYLDVYCSIYEDDHVFGSSGNFFQQIIHKGNFGEDGYRRWVLFPPFTMKIINMLYEAVMSRMNYYHDDEYYFILPEWIPDTFINLFETRGTRINLEAGTYRLYDHMREEYVTPLYGIVLASLKPNDKLLYDSLKFITT